MVFSKQFMVLYAMNTLSVFSGVFAINNAKPYGQAIDFTDE